MASHNYVTLFNLNYLNRGLLMYNSLQQVTKDFNLYVVCFDDATFEILSGLNYRNLIPVSLKQFEDEALLKIKPTRTAAEYCWTCSASVIWFCMNNFKLPNCAYLDADMYFYFDPLRIWNEDPSASVYITLHNYTTEYDQSAKSGRFCVQFVGFKNDKTGMQVLKEWREDCINWCYNRVEEGKFGDQKYLDAWPDKYKNVHIVKDKTAGLAPWNVQQFEVVSNTKVIEKDTGKEIVPAFFHFHGLKIFKEHLVSFTSHYYHLDKKALDNIYKPYAKKLLETDEFLRSTFGAKYSVIHGESEFEPYNFKKWLKFYLYDVKNDLKKINANFTNSRFKNNYTYKIKI
ncbi:MAG: glycosyl transferase [Bacteroidia bacterium]